MTASGIVIAIQTPAIISFSCTEASERNMMRVSAAPARGKTRKVAKTMNSATLPQLVCFMGRQPRRSLGSWDVVAAVQQAERRGSTPGNDD